MGSGRINIEHCLFRQSGSDLAIDIYGRSSPHEIRIVQNVFAGGDLDYIAASGIAYLDTILVANNIFDNCQR